MVLPVRVNGRGRLCGDELKSMAYLGMPRQPELRREHHVSHAEGGGRARGTNDAAKSQLGQT